MTREEIAAAVRTEVFGVLGQHDNDGEPWSGEDLIEAIVSRVADKLIHLVANDQEHAQLVALRTESIADDYPAACQFIDRLTGATP